jgi:hypothetical protein
LKLDWAATRDDRIDHQLNQPFNHLNQLNQLNQPINQSTNQPINQSTNQPTTPMKKLLLLLLLALPLMGQSQTYLLGPQPFDTDVLVHGSTAATTVWFAPNYNTPIDYLATGGNPGGYVRYSASWNNFWGNFVRLPQVDCSGLDTVILSMDMSHSYFAAQPNDWIRFYIWDQGSGSYKNNLATSIKIDGVESIVDFGVNGKGFRFNAARTWARVEVKFNIVSVVNKTNILFYFEPACQYNNSNLYFADFDNISIIADPLAVGREELNTADAQLFPNPANESVSLKAPTGETFERIELFDIRGALVQSAAIKGSSEYLLSTQSLPQGLYHLRISYSDGQSHTQNLSIIH